jgi:hypothetical protein
MLRYSGCAGAGDAGLAECLASSRDFLAFDEAGRLAGSPAVLMAVRGDLAELAVQALDRWWYTAACGLRG